MITGGPISYSDIAFRREVCIGGYFYFFSLFFEDKEPVHSIDDQIFHAIGDFFYDVFIFVGIFRSDVKECDITEAECMLDTIQETYEAHMHTITHHGVEEFKDVSGFSGIKGWFFKWYDGETWVQGYFCTMYDKACDEQETWAYFVSQDDDIAFIVIIRIGSVVKDILDGEEIFVDID